MTLYQELRRAAALIDMYRDRVNPDDTFDNSLRAAQGTLRSAAERILGTSTAVVEVPAGIRDGHPSSWGSPPGEGVIIFGGRTGTQVLGVHAEGRDLTT